MWRDSNESRGFVPLLAHKHYIEHFSNFLYRFRGKLYRDNYRYRIIAQPYYRPISNLPFIGKIIEKVVFKSAEQLLKLKWIPG